MSEILLRGHHVKNLRHALHENRHYSYNHIINEPDKTVKIVAGEIDYDCDNCSDLSVCLDEGKVIGLRSKIFDKMLAYASGTPVGNSYKSSELVNMLQNQNSISYFLRDIGMIWLYLPVSLTVSSYEELYVKRIRPFITNRK